MRTTLEKARFVAVAVAIVTAVSVLQGCGGSGETPAPAPSKPAEPATPAQPAPVAPEGPATDGTAEISGTVRYEGDVPKLPPIQMGADPECLKKHSDPVQSERLVLGEGNTLANVLVRVKSGLPSGRSYSPPSSPATLDQLGCRYEPHVLGVMRGQALRILNSDGLLHNVHSLPKINKGFNRAMPATVTETEYTFDKVEDPFPIKCDVHPWMNAYIAVLDHPYFDVTVADGAFSISGLAAGTYEVEAWHERLGATTTTVTVADGASATADFTLRR